MASCEDINTELLSRTYQELSKEFKEKVSRVVELVPMMYNRLTKVDKMSHKEAVKKILDDHRQVSGFSPRNIIRYLPPDNPLVPHRVKPSWRKSIPTPNNITKKLSNIELQEEVDMHQSQNGEDIIQSMEYNQSSTQDTKLIEDIRKQTAREPADNTHSYEMAFYIHKENYETLRIAMNDSKEFILAVFDLNGKFKRSESDGIMSRTRD